MEWKTGERRRNTDDRRRDHLFFLEKESLPPEDQKKERKIVKGEKFPVLFEDDFVLVINKPAGVAVQPGSGIPLGTSAIERLSAEYAEQTIRPVHRLDKDTSEHSSLRNVEKRFALFTNHFEREHGKKHIEHLWQGIFHKNRND